MQRLGTNKSPRRLVSPKHIAATTAALAVLMLVAALLGMRYTSRNMLRVMEADGAALIESLILSSQNSIKAEGAVLGLLADRLQDDCRSVDLLSNLNAVTLSEMAVARGLSYVDVLDKDGNLLAASSEHEQGYDVDTTLVAGRGAGVFLGKTGGNYGYALRRRESSEIIVCAVDASYIEYFKKDISIGSLLDSLRDREGVVYLLLQDPEEGIIFASKNIEKMKKIEHDPFLRDALESNTARSRLHEFEGATVLEVVKPFSFSDEPYGVFRVGLSLDGYAEVMRGSRRQIAVIMGVLFLVGIVILILLILNQTLQVTSRSYGQIKSFTNAVLESMETGVIAVDGNGIITVLNGAAQRILRLPKSILGTPCDELTSGAEARLAEVLSDNTRGSEFETIVAEKTVLVNTYPLLDGEGNAAGLTALLRDVTQMRKMEKEVKQRERLSLLGDTAASVAHEVRNPLNAISMAAQRLESEYAGMEGMEDAKNFSRILRDEVKRLDGIVGQFLSLARPAELRLAEEDLNRLVEETVTLVREEADTVSVGVEASLGDIPDVLLDRDEMKKAVINILRNGIEAAGPGGTLTVTTEVHDGMIALVIKDSGRGMNEEEISRAFQPYFTTKKGGTGLGLSIAQRVVADHGGRIDADSRPGKGTVFTIYLRPAPRERV
jgi:signal transduction histidine kinase